MRFLIDEDLPRSIKDLLQRYGHEGVDLRTMDLRGSKDRQIAALAQDKGLCLVTGDFDFSNIRNYPPKKYAGIVVLRVPRTATASYIMKRTCSSDSWQVGNRGARSNQSPNRLNEEKANSISLILWRKGKE